MDGENLFIAALVKYRRPTDWETLHTVACTMGDSVKNGTPPLSSQPNPYTYIGSEREQNRQTLGAFAGNVRLGALLLFESGVPAGDFAAPAEQRERIREACTFGRLSRLFVVAAEGMVSRDRHCAAKRPPHDPYPGNVSALTVLEDHLVTFYHLHPLLDRLKVPPEILVDVAVEHVHPSHPNKLPHHQREALCNLAALSRRLV